MLFYYKCVIVILMSVLTQLLSLAADPKCKEIKTRIMKRIILFIHMVYSFSLLKQLQRHGNVLIFKVYQVISDSLKNWKIIIALD